MSTMQQGKVNKVLDKKYRYNDKIMSEREFVEYAVTKNIPIEEITQVKSNLIQLRYNSSPPEQFEYMKREEHLRTNQYPDYIRGNINTPLATYFKSGNTDGLSNKYVSKTYMVKTEKNLGFSLTKTAYEYSKYLINNK